jgi:hypothetical protein
MAAPPRCENEKAMSRIAARTIVWCLFGSLLLLSGLMYPLTVPHAAHHAHHNAATHATVLCNWMCAAGQAVDGPAAQIQSHLTLLSFSDHPGSDDPGREAGSLPLSRGPPARPV